MTYYEILNVDKSATVDEIKSSYKEIAKIYHPDSNFFSEIIQQATDPEDDEVFKYITHAYTTLISENSRNEYNKKLAPELPDWEQETQEEVRIKPMMRNQATTPSANPAQSQQMFQNQMDKLRNLKREQMGIAQPNVQISKTISAATPAESKIRPIIWYIASAIISAVLFLMIVVVLLSHK